MIPVPSWWPIFILLKPSWILLTSFLFKKYCPPWLGSSTPTVMLRSTERGCKLSCPVPWIAPFKPKLSVIKVRLLTLLPLLPIACRVIVSPVIVTFFSLAKILLPIFMRNSPVPLLSASAVKVTEVLLLRFKETSLSIVILLVASRIISPTKLSSLPLEIVKVWLALLPCSAKIRPSGSPSGVPASSWPLFFASTSTISILAGSNKIVPFSPNGAVTSTSPSKAKLSFPDISTKPPFPPVSPPLLLTSP